MNIWIGRFLILFLSANVITTLAMFNTSSPMNKEKEFSDVEKTVINKCRYKDLIAIGETSIRNHHCIHNFIDEKIQRYFTRLKENFFKSPGLEKKVDILEKGLSCIQKTYIQKKKYAYKNVFNQNPNISIAKRAIDCANDCIKSELKNDLDCYGKERYATILWNFLESIKKNPYISKEDKKKIFKFVDKRVKKLKVFCVLPHFPNRNTIHALWHKKKGHHRIKHLLVAFFRKIIF